MLAHCAKQTIAPASTLVTGETCARLHYLVSGTFNTVFLYLLAFSPYSNPPTLTVEHALRAEGPHQFLALNEARDRVYATTWAQPPSLSSWKLNPAGLELEHLNTVPISATGSYLAVLPPRLADALEVVDAPRLYQAGGPVAQTFALDPASGEIADQLAQEIYLDGGVDELWDPDTDRTRVALRYGSHAVDLDPVHQRAYVPHVGRDSIFVYRIRPRDGVLERLGEVPTYGRIGHEGPRHSIPSRDGNKLYVVTEHTSYLDVYDVVEASPYLVHAQRLSVIPRALDPARDRYRGDTLRLSRDGRRLYVTTRGKTPTERGFVSVWTVAASDGAIVESTDGDDDDAAEPQGYGALSRYETATSGGKANAIEVFPFGPARRPRRDEDDNEEKDGGGGGGGGAGTGTTTTTTTREWIALTDDEAGWVTVLEWRQGEPPGSSSSRSSPGGGGGAGVLVEVAKVQLGAQDGAEPDEQGTGASHAVWLS
ncbi:hypothetical protein JCM11491_001145 [Sporobolomyces phaffii]